MAGGCGETGGDQRPDTGEPTSAASQPATTEVRAVRATVKQFAQSVKDSNFRQACALMTDALKAETGDGDAGRCPKYLSLVGAILPDDALRSTIDKSNSLRVNVDGDTATWTTTGDEFDTGRSRLHDGRWLMDTDNGD